MPYNNAKVVEVFRKGGEATPEDWAATGTPVPPNEILILHTKGVKSGLERLVPLRYRTDSDKYVVFASNSGKSTDPDWFRNLIASPTTIIEVGSEVIPIVASIAEGEYRLRIWSDLLSVYPHFAEYEALAGRTIPVVVLTPTS
jgi:deazaflavin-dependent oxidoreductase (nitroreductase family)